MAIFGGIGHLQVFVWGHFKKKKTIFWGVCKNSRYFFGYCKNRGKNVLLNSLGIVRIGVKMFCWTNSCFYLVLTALFLLCIIKIKTDLLLKTVKSTYIINTIIIQEKLEQVDGAQSHIPAPAPAHISVHIKIPNAFLQSSSIGLLPVSFKILAQKAYESCVTIKKKGPKILIFDLYWPQTCPGANYFAPLYSTLHYLRFDTQHDCVFTKWTFDPLGLHPHPSGPAPRGNIKIPNVFLQSSSIGLSPVNVSRFQLKMV